MTSKHPSLRPRGQDALAAAWLTARPRSVRVAYAILGSLAEAEDVVSECWLALVSADRRDPVRDVEAWATVAVSRRALDVLRSARVRREAYPGPWLPEPVVAHGDPADRVTLDESIGYALLVVLETLTPAERTAFVLHDLFGMEFTAVAETVGRSPAAVRQLASRARTHVRAGTPRMDVDPSDHRRTVKRFLTAAAGGDLDDLMASLDPDVVLTSDGGGQVSAARRPVEGAEKVARFLLGLTARTAPFTEARVVSVNGAPGLVITESGTVTSVLALTLSTGRVSRVHIVRAPAKLLRARRP